MKELVIISGKGGTGKTSVTASFAALAKKAVLADCDVDAADLHLILNPKVKETHDFYSGHEAIIRPADCTACGLCQTLCQFDAIQTSDNCFQVDSASCEGCGVCVEFCPAKAIDFPSRLCGEWFISKTRFGMLVHARLGIGAENSGKLVSTVRGQARQFAQAIQADWILVDGPPYFRFFLVLGFSFFTINTIKIFISNYGFYYIFECFMLIVQQIAIGLFSFFCFAK